MDEDSGMEQKTWQVYSFGRKRFLGYTRMGKPFQLSHRVTVKSVGSVRYLKLPVLRTIQINMFVDLF